MWNKTLNVNKLENQYLCRKMLFPISSEIFSNDNYFENKPQALEKA